MAAAPGRSHRRTSGLALISGDDLASTASSGALSGPLQFAAMAGSSIATPGAAGWVTDFLNAAYYAHPPASRDLGTCASPTASSPLAGHSLAGGDSERVTSWTFTVPSGAGDWASVDASMAMPSAPEAARCSVIGLRTRGPMTAGAPTASRSRLPRTVVPSCPSSVCDAPRCVPTAPRRDPEQQHWATYDPVRLPRPDAALAFLQAPARWPDMGCEGGRFTALRSGGLFGQTFEIEVAAGPAARLPIFTRGFVTCTFATVRGASATQDRELERAVDALDGSYRAGAGPSARPLLGDGAKPLALVILTTHAGHFLGSALSHLLVWRDNEGAWIRDVGAWDPLTPHLAAAYHTAGKAAQRQFWVRHQPSAACWRSSLRCDRRALAG